MDKLTHLHGNPVDRRNLRTGNQLHNPWQDKDLLHHSNPDRLSRHLDTPVHHPWQVEVHHHLINSMVKLLLNLLSRRTEIQLWQDAAHRHLNNKINMVKLLLQFHILVDHQRPQNLWCLQMVELSNKMEL